MSISSRNRRAIVYPYAPTSDGGFVTPAYGPARGTYFARVSPVTGEEHTVGAEAEHIERMVFEFSDAVTIALDDLVVENSVQWKVESVTLRRASRTKVVHAFRTDDAPTLAVS
jgi:hypothetical protein